MNYFAGLDWGSSSHAVCVIDDSGRILSQLAVQHTAAGLQALGRQLERIAPAARLPIAIERPSGLVVDTLLHAGHPLVPIHPNVVKACRPRYRAAGGKHDLGDPYLLADVLRTDGHRFRPLTAQSDAIKALRALVRTRDDLVAAEAGVAPVTFQSGKSRSVAFRWACNHPLRRAITTWADNSRHSSSWAADVYARARARGCDHPHAVRILARAWVRVLWKIWTTRTPYNPDQHTSAAAFLKAA